MNFLESESKQFNIPFDLQVSLCLSIIFQQKNTLFIQIWITFCGIQKQCKSILIQIAIECQYHQTHIMAASYFFKSDHVEWLFLCIQAMLGTSNSWIL